MPWNKKSLIYSYKFEDQEFKLRKSKETVIANNLDIEQNTDELKEVANIELARKGIDLDEYLRKEIKKIIFRYMDSFRLTV